MKAAFRNDHGTHCLLQNIQSGFWTSSQSTKQAIRKKVARYILPQKAMLICQYLGEKVVREKLYRSLAIFQV